MEDGLGEESPRAQGLVSAVRSSEGNHEVEMRSCVLRERGQTVW